MRAWIAAMLVLLTACGGAEHTPLPVATSDHVRRQLHRVAGHDRPVVCLDAEQGPVTLRLRETFFDPACLTVRRGQRIRFVNDGNARHNLTIEAAGIGIDVEPGERRSVRLQAFGDDPIDAFCRFHMAAGMIAKITVR